MCRLAKKSYQGLSILLFWCVCRARSCRTQVWHNNRMFWGRSIFAQLEAQRKVIESANWLPLVVSWCYLKSCRESIDRYMFTVVLLFILLLIQTQNTMCFAIYIIFLSFFFQIIQLTTVVLDISIRSDRLFMLSKLISPQWFWYRNSSAVHVLRINLIVR